MTSIIIMQMMRKHSNGKQKYPNYLILNSVRSSCCCDLLIEESLDCGARIMEDFDSDSDTDESMRDDNDAYNAALLALEEALETGELVEVVQSIIETVEIDEGDLFELLDEYCMVSDSLTNRAPPDITELLIRHNHKVAHIHEGGEYLLHKACFNGAPVQILELLLDLNPSVLRKKTSYEMLPLHYASERRINRKRQPLVVTLS